MPETLNPVYSLVLDTTVLSNFSAVHQLPLLENLYRSQACTTLTVVEEIQRDIRTGYHCVAKKHGIALTGTLGILVRLIRESYLDLDKGNQILSQIIAAR